MPSLRTRTDYALANVGAQVVVAQAAADAAQVAADAAAASLTTLDSQFDEFSSDAIGKQLYGFV